MNSNHTLDPHIEVKTFHSNTDAHLVQYISTAVEWNERKGFTALEPATNQTRPIPHNQSKARSLPAHVGHTPALSDVDRHNITCGSNILVATHVLLACRHTAKPNPYMCR